MTMKKLAVGLGVVVLLAGGGLAGGSLYAARQAERQAELVLAQLPPGVTATHGAATYSLFGNRLVVDDVVLQMQPPLIRDLHVQRLTVEGLNHTLWTRLLGRSADGFSARSMVLDRIDYDIEGGLHQSIERASLSEPRLDPPGGTPVEQGSLRQWIAALSLVSAEATNLHIAGDDQATGAKFDIRAASRSISGIKAGHLASEVDQKIAGDLELSQVGKVHFDIAEARADDIDLLGIDKMFDPANYRDGDGGSGAWVRDPAFYTLIGNADLLDLRVSVDVPVVPVTVSLDRLSVSAVKMRQWPFPPTAPPALPDADQTLDLLQSFALGGVELKQLAVTPQSVLIPGSFALGDFVVQMGPGRLEHGEIDGLVLKGPGMSFALGAFQLDGLVVRLPDGFRFDPLGWLANPPGMPRVFFDRYRLADLAIQYPLFGEHSLKELTATMAGSVDKPTRSTFDMTGLAIDFGALASFEPIAKFGYGKVTFDSHGAAIYDLDAKTIDLKGFSVGAPEMGKLSMGYRLGNCPADWPTKSADELQQIAMDIVIEGGEARYDDASLVDHIVALVADATGQTPAATRQSALDWLDEQKATYADGPLVQDALDAMIGFLRAPKSIRIVVKPPSKVTIGELSRLGEPQPNEVMELLGVTVDRP
jgi:hypothetical protein